MDWTSGPGSVRKTSPVPEKASENLAPTSSAAALQQAAIVFSIEARVWVSLNSRGK
jgi:hypothetical protein